MSRKNLEQARERLMRAQEDMLRDLGDLDELATGPGAYSLTHQEAEQLYNDFQSQLSAIQTTLERVLARRTTIGGGPFSAGPKDLGPIPPWITPESGPPWQTPDKSPWKTPDESPGPEPAPPIPPWEV